MDWTRLQASLIVALMTMAMVMTATASSSPRLV
jgi:hypothetical protein